jgi:CBS-domain-containing membrane protein
MHNARGLNRRAHDLETIQVLDERRAIRGRVHDTDNLRLRASLARLSLSSFLGRVRCAETNGLLPAERFS